MMNNKLTNPLSGGESKEPRQSNLEALRIAAMLLVLLIHFAHAHCSPSADSLQHSPGQTIANLCLRSISFVCVNCFILISGYFSIRWKPRSFFGFLFQVVFWLTLGTAMVKVFGFSQETSSLNACLSFVNGRWFVPAYIALYIISPILNEFINNSQTKNLGRYVLCFYIFSTLFGYLLVSDEFNGGMSLISLIGIYLTGAYLRREDSVFNRFSARQCFMSFSAIAVLLVVISTGLLTMGISKSIFGYLNPLIIIQSVFLFLTFRNLKIGNIKYINWIAASAFAVYLFHMHPLIRPHYTLTCKWISDQGAYAPILVILFFITIFIFCTLVDKVRIYIFDKVFKLISHKKVSLEISHR